MVLSDDGACKKGFRHWPQNPPDWQAAPSGRRIRKPATSFLAGRITLLRGGRSRIYGWANTYRCSMTGMTTPPTRNAPAMTLLVVDDESSLIDELRRAFTKTNSSVRLVSAISPQEAERIVRDEPIDAMLVAQEVAQGSGLELARLLKELRPDLPLAFMGSDGHVLSRAVNDLGARRLLIKPVVADHAVGPLLELLSGRGSSRGRIPPRGRRGPE
jgi:ActR/RegA family two-component response regulator